MKKIYFTLSIYLIIAIYQLSQWFECINLTDIFHFSQASFYYQLEEFTHNDKGIPIWQVRIIHNKLTVFVPDAISAYLHLWDLSFLTYFMTFLGSLALFLGIWYFFSIKRRKFQTILFSAILVAPFIEVFLYKILPYQFRIISIWIFFQLLAGYGLFTFLSVKVNNKRLSIIIAGIVISILWIIAFNNQLFQYCVR